MDDDAKGGISPAEFQKGMLEFNNTNVSDEAAASLFEYYSASGGPKVRSAATANHSQALAATTLSAMLCDALHLATLFLSGSNVGYDNDLTDWV